MAWSWAWRAPERRPKWGDHALMARVLLGTRAAGHKPRIRIPVHGQDERVLPSERQTAANYGEVSHSRVFPICCFSCVIHIKDGHWIGAGQWNSARGHVLGNCHPGHGL